MRPVTILGCTGSIGTQTLAVAGQLGLEIAALAARQPSQRFMELAYQFPQAQLALAERGSTPGRADSIALPLVVSERIRWGREAIRELAATPNQTVVNAIVGAVGLEPTLAALTVGNRVALANKESMVIGGALVNAHLRSGDAELIPVDSEHSALFQLLERTEREQVTNLVLTASGGPFWDRDSADLEQITPEQALAHPTWHMGQRITIDSATMANKGMEVIEAHHLFGFPFDHLRVLVHPQSVVHSLIELNDGSLLAQLGPTDMSIPIGYALTYPGRAPVSSHLSAWSLTEDTLSFSHPDFGRFPMLELAYRAGQSGPVAPIVYNAADEIAVAGFLSGRISFLDIPRLTERALDAFPEQSVENLATVNLINQQVRSLVEEWLPT